MPAADRQAIEAKCLKLLATREYSRAELRQKLTGYSAAEVIAVLDELAARGWQSDSRFIRSYIRSHTERGQGKLKIRQALRQKGVTEQDVDTVLAETDWETLACCVYRKKYPEPPASIREAAKRQRFMAQRGFGFAEIQAAMRQDNRQG